MAVTDSKQGDVQFGQIPGGFGHGLRWEHRHPVATNQGCPLPCEWFHAGFPRSINNTNKHLKNRPSHQGGLGLGFARQLPFTWVDWGVKPLIPKFVPPPPPKPEKRRRKKPRHMARAMFNRLLCRAGGGRRSRSR